MKKFFSFLLVLALVLTLAACGSEENVSYSKLLDSYLLNKETILSSDFTLDSELKVGDQTYALTWTSNSEYVKIAETAVDGTYTATVTKPDKGTADVTLTVKLGDATKEFSGFVVKAIEVYDFVDAYVFKQNKATISADFDLDAKFTKWNKECTITWTSLTTDYVTISEDGLKAQVTGTRVETPAKIKATFTYNGETSSKVYDFTIFEKMDAGETINYWYSNTGISQTLSGYVVSVATVYAASFNNISFYMIDDSLQAGYYIFRVGCDAETAPKIVPGAHVTVSGTTNTLYNGWYETNAGGTVVVDEAIAPIDINTTIIDFDNYLTSNTPSLRYHQSTLVKLNGWKITQKLAEPTVGANTNILELERDDVKVQVRVTKYMEGYFSPWAADADPKFTAIVTKYGTLNVGDYVDVTGILGAGDTGNEINLIGADAITVTTAPAAETEGKALNSVIASTVIPAKIKANTEIDLASGAVWTLKESEIAKIENGKLVITPTETENKVQLTATYTNGSFTTTVYYAATCKYEKEEAKPIDIADALKLAKGSEAFVQGTIMAISARGYILYDGTGAIYVYSQNSAVAEEKNHTYVIGDTIQITGKMDYYNVVELVPESSKKVDITAQQLPEITVIDQTALNDYVAAGGSFAQIYVEITGTLSISGNYYNVVLTDGATNQASLSYMKDDMKTAAAGLNGKKIVLKGYAIGHSSNKFMNILVISLEEAAN